MYVRRPLFLTVLPPFHSRAALTRPLRFTAMGPDIEDEPELARSDSGADLLAADVPPPPVGGMCRRCPRVSVSTTV
jgi:hypothetical protein